MLYRPTPIQLRVNHLQQQRAGECLAACAWMALHYVGARFDYQWLVKALRIQPDYGTPFYNIQELTKSKVKVTYQQRGTLEEIHRLLVAGWPCIASVQTGQFPYWDGINTYHAVVVSGMDADFVYLNDPELQDGPVEVSLGDFDLAWLEQDEVYAVLAPPSV